MTLPETERAEQAAKAAFEYSALEIQHAKNRSAVLERLSQLASDVNARMLLLRGGEGAPVNVNAAWTFLTLSGLLDEMESYGNACAGYLPKHVWTDKDRHFFSDFVLAIRHELAVLPNEREDA